LPLGRKKRHYLFQFGLNARQPGARKHGCNLGRQGLVRVAQGEAVWPYTYAGLVRAAASGIVDPEAGVWCVGWDEWRIARDVPGLFEQEPELVPDDQEEVFDSPEGDDRGKSTTKEAATAVSAATKPVAGRGSLEQHLGCLGNVAQIGPTCSLFLLATISREGRGPAGSCDGCLVEQGSPTLATKLVHPPSLAAESNDHQRGGRQQQGRLVKPTQARHGEEQNAADHADSPYTCLHAGHERAECQ
jgi:GYF domain 2